MTPVIENPEVRAVFEAFPWDVRKGLHELRQLILVTGKESKDVAPITEALRWGQPAYLCDSGSTLRLGVPKSGGFALYAHCQTTIISDFVSMFPTDFAVEGNRAVHFAAGQDLQVEKLRFLIKHALTYKV